MMTAKELNVNIAKNLVKYRKANNMTQLELATKLNYSDKAVSKWERAESIPDIYVLFSLAELYGITVNDLLSDSDGELKLPPKKYKRSLLTYSSVVVVWIVATIIFFVLYCFTSLKDNAWLPFIYAIPVSGVVLVVFGSIWEKSLQRIIYASIILWGIALSLFLSFNYHWNWMFFIVAIPLQVFFILGGLFLRKV